MIPLFCYLCKKKLAAMLEELCRFRELYCKAYLERNLTELDTFNRYLDHFALATRVR